ncbi:DUF397 domain-containing protein [Streptomyces sp. Rer75]|uniref:DUF397 domain-containing protein n=1 Tax=Streptomyces sp. Rer75 TaxID=2750011 RepID=UPI0015CFEADD|nr:DUF397 domain-containing protein [Streptomyces sp. Rer75]QLH19330.1 DUF397 domain-containing protein [Streptomyces sp. Rer75]
MERFVNGIPASSITGAKWIKSTCSNAAGACVELTELPDGDVAVRNSRHPEGPALVYTRAELAAFVTGAKSGDFDHMTA